MERIDDVTADDMQQQHEAVKAKEVLERLSNMSKLTCC